MILQSAVSRRVDRRFTSALTSALIFWFLSASYWAVPAFAGDELQPESLRRHMNTFNGLVVCIGEKALDRVSGDWNKPGYTFHCLETSDARVDTIRRRLAGAGCHGKVSAARFDGRHLPYVNNLVSRIVVASDGCAVSSEEVDRALAPYGTAMALLILKMARDLR